MANVLVVVAHPDDEVLGMGGTIAQLVNQGHSVKCVYYTDGLSARPIYNGTAGDRQKMAERAAEILGFDIAGFGTFPDNQLDAVPLLQLVQFLEAHISSIMPSVVYTHSSMDLNIDHRRVLEAVVTATRPTPSCSVELVYSIDVPSATEWNYQSSGFQPDTFVELAKDELEKKIRALRAYSEELRPYPHARSIEAIETRNAFWGNTVGLNYAEPFKTLRCVKRNSK